MFAHLVVTKYRSPPLKAGWIERPSLVQRLDAALDSGRRLTLLSAPAGYGKTTLLAQWTARRGQRQPDAGATSVDDSAPPATAFAWLTLDGGDNDPLRFLAYLVAALQLASPASCAATASLLPAGDARALPQLLPALANDIAAASCRFVVILDDYHEIAAQPVHDIVAFLVKYAPATLHVVISTRVDPPLPLAHLRGNGQMSELRQHDLRFTPAEAGQLVAAFAPQVTPALVEQIHERTEGWAAGLQMAAISLQNHDAPDAFVRAFSGSHRHILDYLSEQVLDNQSPDLQSFLVHTSILERLCAPLCAALFSEQPVGDPESGAFQQLLERLEQDNLFVVALDEQRGWYRYHHLFRDLLQQRLLNSAPALLPRLHARASCWLAGAGLLHEAVEHALLADDGERAADLIARMAETVMKSSEVATLRRWIEALPATALQTHPILHVYHGGALLMMGEPITVIDEKLRTVFARHPAGETPSAGAGGAAAFQALAAVLQGDRQASDRLAQRALTLLPEQSPFFHSCIRLAAGMSALFAGQDATAATALHDTIVFGDAAGDVMNAVLARCFLAQLLMLQGRLHAAFARYHQAAATSGDEPIGGLPLLGLGLLDYDWNELARADASLSAGLQRVVAWSDLPVAQGMLLLARIKRLSHAERAAEVLEQRAEALALHAAGMAPVQRSLTLYLLRHALWKGDLAEAEYHAAHAGLAAAHAPEVALAAGMEGVFVHLTWARLLLAQGHCPAAHTVAAQVAEGSLARGRFRLAAKAQILQALASFASGDASHAVEMLCRALALAAPEGSIRLFVDEGAPMAELLEICRRRQRGGAYAASLLAAFSAPSVSEAPQAADAQAAWPPDPSAIAPFCARLTARELQVLALMADGYSNHEIAQHLAIAASTVKTHINTIFRKLDVTRRTQAIAFARCHRLLE